MNRTTPLVGLMSMALACTPTTEQTADADVDSAVSYVDPGSDPAGPRGPELAAPVPRSITVQRQIGESAQEVELDPRGEVALTVDRTGHVHLWPSLDSANQELVIPFALPIEEPLWISVAQTENDGFVVASIDTANAGHVLDVQPSANGREARVTELFTLAPNDPLLEIHAIDGGQRILALGVDHRIRLYDRTGALLSVIDQRGFLPWQLRVVYGEVGSAPKLAAILPPSKVQRIALVDDQLSLIGEAQQVALDRGPNRNDLLLSPDGKTVATLRRRDDKTTAFTIQLIDLDTNARRLIAGETRTTIRSRMHFVDEGRILLETGNSSGHGLWLDLSQAVAITDIADADPESKFAIKLAKTEHPSIPLPGTAERRPEFFDPQFSPEWDRGDRLHSSVAGGVRVALDRDSTFAELTTLIVDPLASDRHYALARGSTDNDYYSTLDWTGRRQAGAGDETLWIASVEDPLARIEVDHGLAEPKLLAFVDETRIALVDSKGVLALFDSKTGESKATTELDISGGLESIEFIASDVQGGLFGWRGRQRNAPIRLLPIRDGEIGPSAELDGEQRFSWPKLAPKPDEDELVALLGIAAREARLVDEYAGRGGGQWFYTQTSPRTPLFVVALDTPPRTIELPAGQARELEISPDRSKIAIVQFRHRDDDSPLQDHLVSMIDVATGERLWTAGADWGLSAPTWSGDGSRIRTVGGVRDALTGEIVEVKLPDRVTVIERADADWARQAEAQ